MSGFKRFFWSAIQNLGIGQRRCKNCFEPYFIAKEHEFFSSGDLCPKCAQAMMPLQGKRCKGCGLPLPENTGHKNLCHSCSSEQPEWNRAACYGLYENDLRAMLLDFKFHSALYLAPLFADMLLQSANCLPKPDLLVAVPMFPPNLRRRGFNQAYEICRFLAKKGGWPSSADILRRLRMARAQEELTAAERRTNLKGSFHASPKTANYKHIWLIDDIMTTGSTLRECCRALKKAGAQNISVLFVARTPLG